MKGKLAAMALAVMLVFNAGNVLADESERVGDTNPIEDVFAVVSFSLIVAFWTGIIYCDLLGNDCKDWWPDDERK